MQDIRTSPPFTQIAIITAMQIQTYKDTTKRNMSSAVYASSLYTLLNECIFSTKLWAVGSLPLTCSIIPVQSNFGPRIMVNLHDNRICSLMANCVKALELYREAIWQVSEYPYHTEFVSWRVHHFSFLPSSVQVQSQLSPIWTETCIIITVKPPHPPTHPPTPDKYIGAT